VQAKKVDVAGENQDALGLECPEPDVVLHEVLVPFAPVPLHLRTKKINGLGMTEVECNLSAKQKGEQNIDCISHRAVVHGIGLVEVTRVHWNPMYRQRDLGITAVYHHGHFFNAVPAVCKQRQ
jgi:hypothetical protein